MRERSWMRVFRRFASGVVPRWSRMTKNRRERGFDLFSQYGQTQSGRAHPLIVLQEQLKINLEHDLQ